MDFWEIVLDHEKAYFERYFDLIQATVKGETEKLNSEAERISKLVEEEGDPENQAMDYLADTAYEQSELEKLMYQAFVLSVFVFMEDLITKLCRRVQRNTKQLFSVEDTRGSGISRSINYLETVLDRKFPLDSELRGRFEVAWKVRNALAHTGGVVEKGNRAVIEKFISKNPTLLKLTQVGAIEISEEYAKSMISLNTEICDEISRSHKEKFAP